MATMQQPNHVATSAALDAALGRGPPVGAAAAAAMGMGAGGSGMMVQGGKPKVHVSNLDANINAEVREEGKNAKYRRTCSLCLRC